METSLQADRKIRGTGFLSKTRERHAEHARLGLETAFREDAPALRARLHPFGRSRLELG